MNDFQLKDGRRVHLIGDPHLGKKFEVGVPAHRKGERELKQMLTLHEELETDCEINVMVGDLFDHPNVSREVVLAAAHAFIGAAERNSDTLYIAMAGNHDVPRNMTTVGAWPSFRKMVEDRCINLIVINQPCCVGPLAFFPWEWGKTANEQVASISFEKGIEHAIGHWDLSVFDGKDDHLAPVDALREAFGKDVGLWSGHFHKPGLYGDVRCTGSMQPYAHGEGDLYVTLSREEALATLPELLKDKVVRIVLAPGEEMPEIDCLQLTAKRVKVDEEETASLEEFDWNTILNSRIEVMDPAVQAFVRDRISVAQSEEQH